MDISVDVHIEADVAAVWRVITDFEHCDRVITAIQAVKVLERPASGLTGLKWQETRVMYGKPATETMWITEAVEPQYYRAEAQSHGARYLSEMRVKAEGTGTRLQMSFGAEPLTVMAKLINFLMKGAMRKALVKMMEGDLADIKRHIEAGADRRAGGAN
ncbi:SRPBCC family protein [Biformimicrobium ophioploci]|uniref:SRPBCC family protein n=1 Tax=Biformimicrobium ophioploci TaxID=3036711 RepID=A0ABQ6M013_9GAMM|nr:SRPBCC family protein [Microbulbifer sp. NKW57]GMG87685.1 hypothetical protein MNKW57_20060 [Microbulbifer sp. NKW57]